MVRERLGKHEKSILTVLLEDLLQQRERGWEDMCMYTELLKELTGIKHNSAFSRTLKRLEEKKLIRRLGGDLKPIHGSDQWAPYQRTRDNTKNVRLTDLGERVAKHIDAKRTYLRYLREA
jgi:hypothetical protein